MVTVHLAAAIICFAELCHPALIGTKTPTGEFPLVYGTTDDPGYGGDVLAFYEDESVVYAIHRLWLLKPEQKREQRIKSKNPKDRLITSGCINLTTDVYKKLVDCCSEDTLVITR